MAERPKFTSSLNRAVLYWLKYESACGRSRLLSEASLTIPIGDVLHAQFGRRFHRELSFTLVPPGEKKKKGRPTQLDFAITSGNEKTQTDLKYAFECKFITRSTNDAARGVVRDLLRLEGFASSPGRRRFLVVAGIKRVVDKELSSLHTDGRFVLPRKAKAPHIVRLAQLRKKTRKIFLDAIKKVTPPRSFRIELLTRKPINPAGNEYVSMIYEIGRIQNRKPYKA